MGYPHFRSDFRSTCAQLPQHLRSFPLNFRSVEAVAYLEPVDLVEAGVGLSKDSIRARCII